jgi:hypothetical protein
MSVMVTMNNIMIVDDRDGHGDGGGPVPLRAEMRSRATDGGAFVLDVEKSFCSWRAGNEHPRQRQAHGAGHNCTFITPATPGGRNIECGATEWNIWIGSERSQAAHQCNNS